MNDMTISRRGLLGGASAFVTLGGGLRVALGAEPLPEALGGSGTNTGGATIKPAAAGNPILVVIFCRFGQDGLQLVAPSGDANYIAARPTIRIQPNTNMGLGTLDGVDMFFHPNMPELKTLYDANQLATVVAAGVPTNIRSHFEAQDMMERGGADGTALPDNGWLARHMASLGGNLPPLGTVAVSTNMPTSLMGDNQALAIPNPANFNVSGGTATSNVTRGLVRGTTDYEKRALETLDAITNVQTAFRALGTNTQTGYTNGDLSTPLRSLATLIKMNVGVSVATIDMGGWDHHQNLTAAFNGRATELSRSIAAFWNDIAAYQAQTTVVTMTEFGRRFQENANRGLDHGSASTMMVVGAGMNGGKVYGQWPGTAANQLYGGDLAVTTDYRTVLSEIMVKRHNETAIKAVFPNVPYNPLGLFA
ncbi:MAG: DUF1501 domain-containing protein [Rhodospirillaceae bacterium]